MLIDDVIIKISAGDGGRGAVAFNKNIMSLGPTGGSGGNGGSIYIEGVSDLSALSQFRYKKDIKAENGGQGRGQFRDGPNGKDLFLKVPVGTVIQIVLPQKTKGIPFTKEVLKVGERVLIAEGGHGGKGNFLFRGPKNTSPKQFQEGLPGERFTARMELKLIADVGLIGLPNAGKSSLLNELTASQSKVANYPFTTLEPNLGVYFDLILADIPGLIEGASAGRGLGIKFLKHIERTKILFHLVSAESKNPTKDYKIIKKELAKYNKELARKTEYVFLSKSDTLPKKELTKRVTALKKIAQPKASYLGGQAKNIFPISVYDWDSLEKVKALLSKIQSKKFAG